MRPTKRGPQSILALSSDEVNDVVAYLRSWEYSPPFAPDKGDTIPHRFVMAPDLRKGDQLYASFCAGCHGDRGKGSWAPELNNEGFLASATDGFLQATIIQGRPGTAMRPFGPGAHGIADLSGDDIDNIVGAIRNWARPAASPISGSGGTGAETNDAAGSEDPTDEGHEQSSDKLSKQPAESSTVVSIQPVKGE